MRPSRPPREAGGRALRADEIRLWREIAATISHRMPAAALLPASPPDHPAEPVAKELRVATAARPPVPSPGTIERSLHRKLAGGRRAVEAVLDLHGHRQAEAHARLEGFLHRAHRDRKKVVLVITGKGGEQASHDVGTPARGVLRRLVPLWLAEPRLASLVVAVAEAGRAHGGEGALYVHLRNPGRRLTE
jgi:DNA-nicking Smr family endonuclease